jgi:CPA1 family monovalent cation:H+ antiporter
MGLRIERIEELLLIAAVVAMLARRLHLPYTIGLTLAGIGVALSHFSLHVELTRELIFTALLPPLIFEAALQMHWSELRVEAGVVILMATFGIILAAGFTAIGLHYFAIWPWAISVPLAILISATDPVSVIATFKEAGVTGRLRLLVESESLLNDGTVAVLYSVTLAVIAGGEIEPGNIAARFFVTVVGAILCGAVVGGLGMLLVGRTDDHLIEITFSTAAAYGSFLLAEHFACSGVLATMTTGVLMGNTIVLGEFSPKGLDAVASFWEYVGFVANSVIFLLIGVNLVVHHVLAVLSIASLTIPFVICGRVLAVYGCCAMFAKTKQRVPLRQQHLLVWGGLRGALALALSLGLPANLPERDTAISVTFAVVAFSILVQGLTITPVLRLFGELDRRDVDASLMSSSRALKSRGK